jgi:hypothetical protein
VCEEIVVIFGVRIFNSDSGVERNLPVVKERPIVRGTRVFLSCSLLKRRFFYSPTTGKVPQKLFCDLNFLKTENPVPVLISVTGNEEKPEYKIFMGGKHDVECSDRIGS